MGSGGPERHRRQAIARRRPHLRRRISGAIPALQRSEQRKGRLGKLLGITADLLRGFAGAGMQLGGFTAVQSPARRSSARRGRAARRRRLRCCVVRVQGRDSVFKGKDLGVLGIRVQRSLAVIHGWAAHGEIGPITAPRDPVRVASRRGRCEGSWRLALQGPGWPTGQRDAARVKRGVRRRSRGRKEKVLTAGPAG